MLSKQQLANKLAKTSQLINSLSIYSDRVVNQLPKELIDDIKNLNIGPQITSSGLEKVDSVLTSLYVIQMRLKEAYEDPESFQKFYTPLIKKNRLSNTSKSVSIPAQNKIDEKNKLPHTTGNTENHTKPAIKININEIYKKPESSVSKTQPTNQPTPPSSPPPSSSIEL